MDDTSPDMKKKMQEMIAAKDPRALKMGCSMYDTSRYLVESAILKGIPQFQKVILKKKFY